MKILTIAAAATLALSISSLLGCALEPENGPETDTSTEASHDDGNVGTVAQELGPQNPCQFIPGGCEGGNGQGGAGGTGPEHHNKNMVKMCASQQTKCKANCNELPTSKIAACKAKCTTAHKECLEDY